MKKEFYLEEKEYKNIDLGQKKFQIIFLYGNLGAGKSSFVRSQLKKIGIMEEINSPTYTYYNKYGNNYHFDLYRLNNYDEFIQIAGEEILDNNQGLIFVEWPQIIEKYYKPDIKIFIEKENSDENRKIIIEYL